MRPFLSLTLSLLLLAPAPLLPAALAQGSRADYARSAELPCPSPDAG